MLIAVLCIIGILLIVTTIQDVKSKSMSVIFFPITIAVCTILNIFYIIQSGNTEIIISLLAGGVGYFIITLILKLFKKIGWGDVLLISVVGGSLGWFRITEILIVTCIAAVIYILIKKPKNKKIPFAPFMLIGFAVDIIYGICIRAF